MTLLNWIQGNYGGNVTKARQNIGKNWKPVYRIQFYGETADTLLRIVRPYLVIKGAQADLYLELRDRMKKRQHPLSSAERATREDLYLQCKELNQRGIGQVERLSEETPALTQEDAIVRTVANMKATEIAEMAIHPTIQ
jgi:hypothetical protein